MRLSVKATCTGCLLPACDPAQALARSLSSSEGGGGLGGGVTGASSQQTRSGAEGLALKVEGRSRGWCEWRGVSLAG